MTSYRTIVPGMNDYSDPANMSGGDDNRTRLSIYDEPVSVAKTRIGGIEDENISSRCKNQELQTPNQPLRNKPLVGFLVSLSRYENGEFWALKQGQNMIGASDNCDIQLDEASVSSVHAVLAIHRNPKNNNSLNVGIIDKGSSNGVFVNDEYIGFEPYQCNNLDKIRVGNYELLLMLFDASEHNMKPAAEFKFKDTVNTSNEGSSSSNKNNYDQRENYTEAGGGTLY